MQEFYKLWHRHKSLSEQLMGIRPKTKKSLSAALGREWVKKCGFWKSQPDVQLSDFAAEEEFESLVKELSTDVSAAGYINFDQEVVTSQPSIDVKNIAWRQESRQNAIDTVMGYHNDQEHLKDFKSDDEEVTIDDFLTMRSISEALQLVVRITCFTRQYEDVEIKKSLEVLTEKLKDIMIRNRQQKKITDYFNLWCKINWYITKNITSFSPFHIPIVK